jgi:hypothetical protein
MPDSSPLVALRDVPADELEVLHWLAQRHILPVYAEGEDRLLLRGDLAFARRLAAHLARLPAGSDQLFASGPRREIPLGGCTQVQLVGGDDAPALGPGVAALEKLAAGASNADGELRAQPWLPGATVISGSQEVLELARAQARRAERLSSARSADLSGSTSYMGSKRELGSFLVEALWATCGSETTVLDLMCGSGAATGAFSDSWPTIAGDAQEFCRLLALTQGRGLTLAVARDAVARVLGHAGTNADRLLEVLAGWVTREDELLHAGDRGPAVEAYRGLLAGFPTLSNGLVDAGWDPREEVRRRRAGEADGPWCLFTAYFANVFFGIRQCIEIDSLRAGIELLPEPARSWALGALIASVSATGTTYGAHFAQPLIGTPEKLSAANISRTVEQRALSVAHEFSSRLLSLAAESERAAHDVTLVAGDWREAIARSGEIVGEAPCMVYLDPPYRREEYSRYYHVLETLVRYDYPSAEGHGLTPAKGIERFRSPFFTRSNEKRRMLLTEIIGTILDRGWGCAWSYASNADGSVPDVLRSVASEHSVTLRSFVASHRHRAHGGRRGRRVDEYLVVVERSGRDPGAPRRDRP